MNPLPAYRYGAARTMVYLHEQYMQEFLAVWQKAKTAEITLPQTDDPNYISLDMLLRHVFSAARYYMVWMCENLELPDPEIDSAPKVDVIAAEVESYLAHLTRQWRLPLATVDEERFNQPEYPSSWKTKYCVDAMLEHAVMHPVLHRIQLEELLGEQVPLK